MNAHQFLCQLCRGGVIVAATDLSPESLAIARSCDRMFVDDEDDVFVYMPTMRQFEVLHAPPPKPKTYATAIDVRDYLLPTPKP